MAFACCPAERLIQLNSSDPLWEWHIPSDRLFLSLGACRQLGFGENAPATMTDFLAHVPTDCRPSLHDMVEGALSGATGPLLEVACPVDNLMVHMHLLVTEREAENRATRVVGTCCVSETQAYQPPLTSGGGMPDIGYWFCSLTDRRIRLDGHCAALLGFSDAQARVFTPEQWQQRLHPEEGNNFTRRYQLTLEQPQFGDVIEDLLRVRLENGEYKRFILHGAVLERSPQGRALELAGRLQLADVSQTGGPQTQSKDTGRLLLAINAAGDGLWDWDAKTDEVYYSPRYLSMLGYTAEQFPGNLEVWKKKIHPDDIHKIVPPQAALVASPRYGDTFECTYRLRRADGTWAWILGRGYVTHRDAQGRATRLVGLHTDITATQGDREKLEDLVRNDALTGLRSRAFLNMEVERIERNRIRPVSVIACDVNGLKLVNDYLGHAAGDKLLVETALMLRHCLRATDCIARMGGDEFTVLLPGCPENTGQEILEQLKAHFDQHNASDQAMPILMAFGIAHASDMGTPLARLLVAADRNMLRHKHATRQRARGLIKSWIEGNKNVSVSLEDDRY